MQTERCEDCCHSRPSDMKGCAPVAGWLLCDQKPAYVYLSAPLAVCTFEPSRFKFPDLLVHGSVLVDNGETGELFVRGRKIETLSDLLKPDVD